MKYKIFGGFLILLGLIIFASVAYRNSHRHNQPIVFSHELMLNSLWSTYKKTYIDSTTGRTLDKQRDNITTSEGESYTMLRSVWQDDKTTFDTSWHWTQKNLGRQPDHLFSWLYGTNDDGTMGILTTKGGQNTATDADTDIAMALLLASNRWQDQTYAQAAKQIISDIWDNEVVTIQGIPYISADNVEKTSTSPTVVINPSYFSPYAYRIFKQVDPNHAWDQVITSSYTLIQYSINSPLDKKTTGHLPPDWIAINRTTGAITPANGNNLSTNFSYDALRLPWRIAVDYEWNQDPRSLSILQSLSFLSTQWHQSKMIANTYSHDGSVISHTETPAMYGGIMVYFMFTTPTQATEIYREKLETLYNPDIQSWGKPMSYYDDNWAWFGIALYQKKITNLFNPSQQLNSNASSTNP